ncbi:MAG: hypothetical protein KatS3mg102_2605 [Planctomycetota bacterium]|nr:MAG: hypothetical protein KatS3mg102_2605 [Planctomycetota bacterium]
MKVSELWPWFFTGGLILLIIGGGFWGFAYQDTETLSRLESAELLDPAQAAARGDHPGPVKVAGRLGARQPARLPETGEQVVYGRVTIQATRKTVEGGQTTYRTTTLRDAVVTAVEPWIEGTAGGARLPVAVDGAEIVAAVEVIPLEPEIRGSALRGEPYRIRYGDQVLEWVPPQVMGDPLVMVVEDSFEAHKLVLQPGAEVVAVGALQGGGLVAPPEGTLVIYAGQEEQIASAAAARVSWMMPLAKVLLVLAALSLLAALVTGLMGCREQTAARSHATSTETTDGAVPL